MAVHTSFCHFVNFFFSGQEAKLGKKSEDFDDPGVLVPQRSKLRSKNAPLLEGGRYAGKSRSRRTASNSDSGEILGTELEF